MADSGLDQMQGNADPPPLLPSSTVRPSSRVHGRPSGSPREPSGHPLHPPPLPPPPRGMVSTGKRYGKPIDVQDISQEYLTEADMRARCTEYLPVRFERTEDISSHNDRNNEGEGTGWEQPIRTLIQGMSNEEIKKQIRRLDKSHNLQDLKETLSNVLVRQLETMNNKLSRKDDDPVNYFWTLAQLDQQLQEVDVNTAMKHIEVPRVFHEGSRKKKYWRRISVTAYFKRAPRPGANVKKLYEVKKIKKEHAYHTGRRMDERYPGRSSSSGLEYYEGIYKEYPPSPYVTFDLDGLNDMEKEIPHHAITADKQGQDGTSPPPDSSCDTMSNAHEIYKSVTFSMSPNEDNFDANKTDSARNGLISAGMDRLKAPHNSAPSDISSDTSSSRKSYACDTISIAQTEITLYTSNVDDVLYRFVDMIFECDEVAKALEHLILAKTSATNAIKWQVRVALKSFVELLKRETEPHQHDKIPSVFNGRSQLISARIVSVASGRCAIADKLSRGADVTDSENEDDDQNNNEPNLHEECSIDIEAFSEVVYKSRAFEKFLGELYDIAFPSFSVRLGRLLRRLQDTDRWIGSKLDEVFSKLAYSQPTSIAISTDGPGLLDQAQEVLLSFTEDDWDWWPLQPPRKTLKMNEVRINWICKCGRDRYATVPKQIAKQLVRLVESAPIQSTVPNRPRLAPSDPREPTSLSSISPEASGTSSGSSAAESSPASSVSGGEREFGQVSQSQDYQNRTIFFMVEKASLHPSRQGLAQSPISPLDKCNDVFFNEMRTHYWKTRGWLRQAFSIYKFGYCDFYQFNTYATDRFAPVQEGIPDLKQHHQNYYYEKVEWKPQLSREEFRDRFWNCIPGCSCNDHSAVNLIPQKILGDRVFKDKVFWGIVARERKMAYMVVIYLGLSSLSVIPSVWFLFQWLSGGNPADQTSLANHKDNLSNAAVPLSTCIALFMGVLGTLLAI